MIEIASSPAMQRRLFSPRARADGARSMMFRQRSTVIANAPNLIAMRVADAPIVRSIHHFAAAPCFRLLQNKCSRSSNPHSSQRLNAPS